MTPEQTKRLVDVFLWKLGILEPSDYILAKDTWQKFRNEPVFRDVVDRISREISNDLLAFVLREHLTETALFSDGEKIKRAVKEIASDNRMREELIA
ncbi:MAG: hypothetical protein H7Z17_11805, partial [Fuerstia sp.]|nr:hypothetical protein [Fuerstiella sp.]